MTIYCESIISKIGKALGMKDIQIGNPLFDEAFVIKARDEMILRNFLSSKHYIIVVSIIFKN